MSKRRSSGNLLAAIGLLFVALALFAIAGILALFAGYCEGDCPSGSEVIAGYVVPALLAFFPLWASVRHFMHWHLGTRSALSRSGTAGISALLVIYPFIALGLARLLGVHGDTQWASFTAVAGLAWPALGAFAVARYARRQTENSPSPRPAKRVGS